MALRQRATARDGVAAAKRFALGLAAAAGLAGCGGAAVRGISLELLDPDSVLDRAARLELVVSDERARCAGSAATGGAPIPGDARMFRPTETVTLQVSPGHRTFALRAFPADDTPTPIGLGCKEADLSPGANVTLTITLIAFGVPDMGVDLAPPDAAAPRDLATTATDQAVAADSSPPGDLTVFVDQSPPADVATGGIPPADLSQGGQPDFARPPDLAAPASTDLAGADLYSFLPGDHCPGTVLPPNAVVSGTTKGYLNDGSGSCAPGPYPDRIYRFTINQPQEVVINVNAVAANQEVYLVGGSCGGSGMNAPVEQGCADAPGLVQRLDLPNLAQGTYWIFVAGVGGGGDFTIQWQSFPPKGRD